MLPSRRRPRAGFTLLEMMAVILLVSIVFFVAVDFYRQLTRASAHAADLTRNARRAVALADRMALDLEASMLLKKPKDVDPLQHPWLFLGAAEPGSASSDRMKFVTRSANPRTTAGAESDLQMVAWLATPAEDGSLEVRRWSAPRLPEGLDRDFPPVEDAYLVARGLAAFGVRFLDENGEWKPSWDSSELVDADKLPLAVEITLAFAPPELAVATADAAAAEPEVYTRRVLLPLRALDLKQLITGQEEEKDATQDKDKDEDDRKSGHGGKEEAQACVTVQQCLEKNPQAAAAAAEHGLSEVLQSIGDQCFSAVAGSLPPGLSLQGCE